MTRIISGFAGSLTLQVPRSGTRPTSDRVREAIFSALEARDAIDRARVVDLYAGSGALGLEAASRGASHVTLVEKAAQAASVAKKNAGAITRAGRGASVAVVVATQAVQAFLGSRPAGEVFDLVFLDPPYELGEAELAADLAAVAPMLSPDAVLVVERSARSPEPTWPASVECERRKDYGETTVWWASPA